MSELDKPAGIETMGNGNGNGGSSAPSAAVGVGMILAVVFGFLAQIYQTSRFTSQMEKNNDLQARMIIEIHDMNAQNKADTASRDLQYPPQEWREMRDSIQAIKRTVGAR